MRRRAHAPVLLVGFGLRGRAWRGAIERHGSFCVVGVVDPHQAARSAAEAAGLEAWPSLADALHSAQFAAAVVASPPQAHAVGALTCLDANVPVLVEKPLALTLVDAGRIADRAAATGRPVVVGQNFRFLRRERAVRRALPSIGRPVRGVVESARPRAAIPAHLEGIEHGALWDFAIHHLDVLRARHGTPATVSGRFERSQRDVLYTLELAWSDGLRVRYSHCEGAACAHYHEWFDGDAGTLLVDGRWVRLRRPGVRARPILAPFGASPEAVLLDALDAGRGDGLDVVENLETVATVEAAVRAVANGETVDIADHVGAAYA